MDDAKTDSGEIRAAALDTIVRELASYAVLFALSWAILHRDEVTRTWMRLTRRPVTALEARIRRETASLRREICRYEHSADRAPSVPSGGLYGAR